MTKRLAVLVSGRGSNLQALIDVGADALGGEIALVVSNVESAEALDRARRARIPAIFRDHRSLDREAFDEGLIRVLHEHTIDLVCLAGFMRRLSARFVRAYPERILNVHPSLLPAFPGLDAQRQALAYGVKVSGATVHLVDQGLDSGPIVAQEAVPVLEHDSPETLGARILEVEHRLYPRAVRIVLDGSFRFAGRRLITEDR